MGFKMNKKIVQDFIVENINPGLEMHGGFLTAESLNEEDGVLFIVMGGGCQGCSAASQTLRFSIDALLKEEFPKIKNIVDVTQHSKGENPYYE